MTVKKLCRKCQIEKDLTEFYIHADRGLRSECKTCVSERNKKYSENNKELKKERYKKYAEKNKEKIKEYQAQRYLKNKEQLSSKSKKALCFNFWTGKSFGFWR